MKKKVLAISILTIVLCMSLIAGAVMALFTSESKVNIAVSSGTVDVQATIVRTTTYSMGTATAQNGTFENGGTASVDGSSIVLDRMTPGDKLVVEISIANTSNVAYAQRFTMAASGDQALQQQLLFGVSAATTSGTEGTYTYYNNFTSAWEKDAAASQTRYIVIELPEYAGNSAQGKSCAFVLTVEAVQGNADTSAAATESRVYIVDATTNLESTISNLKDGETLVLGGSAETWASQNVSISFNDSKTINVCGYKVGSLTINAQYGTVNVYNDAGSITATSVAGDSLHVYGNVDTLTVKSGRVVVEAGASVGMVEAEPSASSNVTVEFAQGASVEAVSVDTSATDSSANLVIEEGVTVPSLNISGSGTVTIDNSGVIEDSTSSGNTPIEQGTVTTIEALQSAVALGGKVVLGADVIGNIVIEEGTTVELDLNEHSLTTTEEWSDSVHTIINRGTLTVKNGSIVNESTKGTDYGPNAAINSVGTLTLQNCSISSNAGISGSYCVGIKGGHATIDGCTIYGARGGMSVEGDAAVTVSNCSFTAAYYYPLYIYGNGQSTFIDVDFIKVPKLDWQENDGGNALIYNDIDPVEYGDTGTVTFTRCSFESTREGGSNLEIAASYNKPMPNYTGVTFSGCTFTNVHFIWDGNVDTSWYQATSATFTLETPMQFAGFAQLVNGGNDFSGKTVTLAANIDLNGQEWTPIGQGERDGNTYTEASKPFRGTFDGNNHTISGLKITSGSGDTAIGLFGVVDGGKVCDLVLSEVAINVSDNECAGGAIGLLVGNGTAENITVSGSVTASRGNGGIVGRMTVQGTIRGCTNNAAVTATGTGGNTGGIVGAAYYTGLDVAMQIESCNNNGTVTGYLGVGGIVGLSSANVTGCTNTGAVNGNGESVGGIVGEQQNYGCITNNVNTAAVTNASTSANTFGTGGIVGWARYNGADSNYPRKEMIEVTGNRNSGSVTGGGSSGGIVGHMYNVGLVTGNVNTAQTISSANFAAGLVGSLQYATGNTYETCNIHVTGNVSTTPLESIVGSCKDLYAYNNRQAEGDFVVENNSQTETTQPEA